MKLEAVTAVLLGILQVAIGLPGQAADADSAVVSEQFVYETAPFPSCHAATLVETPRGLLAAWFGGTHERHPDVAIWTSRYENGAWTAPECVADGVDADGTRYPTWNPVLFQPSQGPLLLFYKVGPTPRDWWGLVKTSDDNGETWSAARRLPDSYLGPIKNKPIELSADRLILPSSSEHDGWKVHFEFTNRDATKWERTEAVADPQAMRAIQPSVLPFDGNRLVAVGRTRASGVFVTESSDGGTTWGPLEPTGLPNPSAGTDAVRLADGRCLLVYNHSSTERIPLNVAVSRDGRQWQSVLVLEDDAQAPNGFAYPAIIQTSDGLVHIAYTWRRERIKHVVLDPTRIASE